MANGWRRKWIGLRRKSILRTIQGRNPFARQHLTISLSAVLKSENGLAQLVHSLITFPVRTSCTNASASGQSASAGMYCRQANPISLIRGTLSRWNGSQITALGVDEQSTSLSQVEPLRGSHDRTIASSARSFLRRKAVAIVEDLKRCLIAKAIIPMSAFRGIRDP